MTIALPVPSLVVLVGAAGAGKSSFARRHFLPTEVVSSDACRGMVADDENLMDANADAFHVLHTIVAARLARGRLTVVDATNLQPEARRPLVALARDHDAVPVAIVFETDGRTLMERNRTRPERTLPPHVIPGHVALLRRLASGLEGEGFRHVYALHSAEEVDATTVERLPRSSDRSDDRGPSPGRSDTPAI
ncbi:MAG TPA: AAA family ATPase [Candidatus Dormibacteraeota bacterium]|nr:AAA family ATPase [Candidatus Dormibacteraeota bacterium]